MRRVVAGLVFAIASCVVTLWAREITAQLNSNSFAPPAWYNAGANQTWAVTAGDLNNDGFADVVVTSHCYSALSCNTGIGVFLNDGSGGLLPGVRYESGAPGGDANQSVAIADLDGDGTPDLVVLNAQSPSVSFVRGNGDGTFQTTATYLLNIHPNVAVIPNKLTVADVNGDSRPDIMVSDNLLVDPNHANAQ